MYKFYTAENPSEYIFKNHIGPIRSIAWLQDDTGFVSSAWDSSVCMWALNPKDGKNPVWSKKMANVDFTCVKAYKPDGEKASPKVFATGMDKSIRELQDE